MQREVDALREGHPTPDIPSTLSRAAIWRAARSGLEGDLVDLTGPDQQARARGRQPTSSNRCGRSSKTAATGTLVSELAAARC